MLSAIIIGEAEDSTRYLRQVCVELSDVWISKVLPLSARRYEVSQVLNAYGPDVVFLDVSDIGTLDSGAASCLRELLPRSGKTALVPFVCSGAPQGDNPLLQELGPVLRAPFTAEDLERALREALRRGGTADSQQSRVVSLLPSKPGAGATTIALELASIMARSGSATLIIEADLRSGPIAYLLGLQPPASVCDAIANPRLRDETEWRRLVSRGHGFDVLPACGGRQAIRNARWDFYRLLRHTRELYRTVIVDLGDGVDEVAESVIRESDRVVMVCTPENTSLSMARRRLWELETWGIRHNHLEVWANQHRPADATAPEMASVIRREITQLLPEDGEGARAVERTSGQLPSKSRLAKAVAGAGGELLGLRPKTAGSAFGYLKEAISRALVSPAATAGVPSSRTWR